MSKPTTTESSDIATAEWVDVPATVIPQAKSSHLKDPKVKKYSPLFETTASSTLIKTNRGHQEEESKEDFFSACLLVRDENHRLPEWIAYHYFMLPLRHLVVMADPDSQHSPKEILQRWSSSLPYLRMEIEFWTGGDASIGFDSSLEANDDNPIRVHFNRQRTFYHACANHLRQRNRTWTTFHDADEYIYLDPDAIPDAKQRMAQPGSIQTFLDQVRNHLQSSSKIHNTLLPVVPRPYLERPCIMVARTLFGATESPTHIVQNQVPPYFNGSHFETLRYLHRADHGNYEVNQRAKSLVHVSLATDTEWTLNQQSIHNILQHTCRLPRASDSPIRIRHYLGDWQAHTVRIDPRAGTGHRNSQWYEYRAQLGHDQPDDDAVRPWLSGLTKMLDDNVTLMQHLLRGAGQYPPSPPSSTNMTQPSQEWELSPFVMETEMDRNGDKPGTFGHWLKQHYDIVNLPDGTLAAQRKAR